MKIKVLCGQTILQHERIHNTMSHVNIEQSRVGRNKYPIPNIEDLYAKLTGCIPESTCEMPINKS